MLDTGAPHTPNYPSEEAIQCYAHGGDRGE